MSPAVGEGVDPRGLRLDELARELPMQADVEGDAEARVTGVRHDSRAVRPGELFVARKGEKADGARFVADAVARGASAVMAARGAIAAREVGVPVLFVDDPAAALAFAASAVYGHPSFALEVVGITGTNGKTTTAHLARAAIDGAHGMPAASKIDAARYAVVVLPLVPVIPMTRISPLGLR